MECPVADTQLRSVAIFQNTPAEMPATLCCLQWYYSLAGLTFRVTADN